MKTIDLAALATVTGGAGFFDRFKAPAKEPVVTSTNGGVAIGGNVIGSTITVGPNSPGISIQGDVRGGSIINGQYYK